MENDIRDLFKTITNEMKRKLDAELKEYGLSFSQLRAMQCVYEHGGEITQRHLEENLCVSHAATHGLISRLEAKGFLRTYIDKSDRRNVAIVITREGQERIHTLLQQKERDDLMAILTEEDRADLRRILTKIVDRIYESNVKM